MTNTAKTLDPSVTFFDSARNWTVYAQLFPDVPGYFTAVVIKNFFTALAASVIFYAIYYRKHQNIMYGDRREILETEKKQKTGSKETRFFTADLSVFKMQISRPQNSRRDI